MEVISMHRVDDWGYPAHICADISRHGIVVERTASPKLGTNSISGSERERVVYVDREVP